MTSSTIEVVSGRIGSIRAGQSIVLRPLTLLLGEQGTGKSLISQLAYVFSNLDFLLQYEEARLGPGASAKKLLKNVLDNIRDGDALFRSLIDRNNFTNICWKEEGADVICFEIEPRRGSIKMNSNMRKLVRENKKRHSGDWKKSIPGIPAYPQATYVSAERVLLSHANPMAWGILSVPLTLIMLGEDIAKAARSYSLIKEHMNKEEWYDILGGIVARQNERWKWETPEGRIIGIGSASTGQKMTWPLLLLADALPVWEEEGGKI